MTHRVRTRLKLVGLGLLALPILALLVFTVAEVTSGDLSGLQHLAQLAPLAVLAWFAWRQPFRGGLVLVGGGVILIGLFVVFAGDMPRPMVLFALALLFLPPLLAGALFVRIGQQQRVQPGQTPPPSLPPAAPDLG